MFLYVLFRVVVVVGGMTCGVPRAVSPHLRSAFDEDEILGDNIGDVQIDDPIHEVEADEADGKDDAGVLVNVGWREAPQLVEILTRWDHDGCGLFVDPRAVDDRRDGRWWSYVARWSVPVVAGRSISVRVMEILSVRLHQEPYLLHYKS